MINIHIDFNLMTVLEVVTLIWGIYEYLNHRDFKNKAEVWWRDAQTLATDLTKFAEACREKNVSSVRDAGQTIEAIAWPMHGLLASLQDAVKKPTLFKRMLAKLKPQDTKTNEQ